jgi:hypothetical protein
LSVPPEKEAWICVPVVSALRTSLEPSWGFWMVTVSDTSVGLVASVIVASVTSSTATPGVLAE